MRIKVLTLFPGMFPGVLDASILGRAQKKGLLSVELIDIRAFSTDPHRRADDYPFGGGAGLVMTAQPILAAFESAAADMPGAPRLCLSPRGAPLTQATARRLSQNEGLILLCGHYEGIDQRALDTCVDGEISIGDYVLTCGELPAMVLIDCVARLIPGVLDAASTADESFEGGLLEYPQYTRPAELNGMRVPEVLLSGHHKNIEAYRRRQSLLLTLERRPDMLDGALRAEAERLRDGEDAGDNARR